MRICIFFMLYPLEKYYISLFDYIHTCDLQLIIIMHPFSLAGIMRMAGIRRRLVAPIRRNDRKNG